MNDSVEFDPQEPTDLNWEDDGCKSACLAAHADKRYDDMCDDCYDEVCGVWP